MPIPVSSGAEARRRNKRLVRSQRRQASRPAPKYKLPSNFRTEAAAPKPPARRPSRPAVKPKPHTLPKTFRSDAAQGGPTKRQKRFATRVQRKARRRVVANQLVARRQFERRSSLAGIRRKQERTIRDLGKLEMSDPGRRERVARSNRSGLDNTIRDIANTANKGISEGASVIKKGLDTGVGKKLTEAAFASKGIKTSGVISQLPKEAVDIVASAPTGAYLAGAAAKEAAQGRPQRAQGLIKDFKDTSALYSAATGDFGEAAKRASERPLTTALELSGAKAVVGRTGGAVARKAPIKAVRQAGSTQRSNLKLYDPVREPSKRGPEIERRYSKDIINKGGQVLVERARRRRGENPDVARDFSGPRKSLDGKPEPPARRRLKRRIDTRVHSRSRVLDQERNRAARDASRAERDKGLQASQVAELPRVRERMTDELRHADPERAAFLRERQAKSDKDLLRDLSEERQRKAVAEVVDRTNAEHAALMADEFAVDLPNAPRVFTAPKPARDAAKAFGNPDLVPMKRAEGEYVLVPSAVRRRVDEHRAVESGDDSWLRPGGKFDRSTAAWKDVVLTTSSPSRWIGGNVADMALRNVMAGQTPLDIVRGAKVDRRLKQQGLQGQEASASLHGGGMFSVARQTSADEGSGMKPLPGGKLNVPGQAYRGWKKFIYSTEHAIETLPQFGATGKAMRQETARTKNGLRGLLKLSDEQMTAYAKGVSTSRAKEARLQKNVEDVIGRWGKVSPSMRKALAFAPFAQWLGASTRYVLMTLPLHHPIKTAILAGIMEMTEEERVRLGLSYYADPAKRAPDFQMGMLPTKVGQNEYGPTVEGIRTSRMTSFGTAANSVTGVGLPEFLLPQFAGAMGALTGNSFTGEKLVYPDEAGEGRAGIGLDPWDRTKVALGSQIETAIPFASAFRRTFLEQGRPADPASTILEPKLRKNFDYESGQYTDPPPGDIGAGLRKWGLPYAPPGRMYTQGAQRDIQNSRITRMRQEQSNKRRKVESRVKKREEFWGGEAGGPPSQREEFWKQEKAEPTSKRSDFWD